MNTAKNKILYLPFIHNTFIYLSTPKNVYNAYTKISCKNVTYFIYEINCRCRLARYCNVYYTKQYYKH